MNALESKLVDYWTEMTGESVNFIEHTDTTLPLYLRQRYGIGEVDFLGKKLVLAFEEDPPESFSVREYERHASILRGKLGAGVVFVFSSLPSYARSPMIQRRIPFVVPQSQTFLPSIWMDLRERQPLPPRPVRKKFTPAAQCLLLYHLQRNSLEAIPLQEIAKMIRYSPIMVTKVKTELEAAGLCQAVRKGRTVVLNFNYGQKQLWEQARPFLFDPVLRRHWVKWDQPGAPALLAGISALARKTLLSSDRMPTFALDRRKYSQLLHQGTFCGCRGQEDATARIESWAYDPTLLSAEDCVDSLSLSLSLADSPDERVQQQVGKLLENISW